MKYNRYNKLRKAKARNHRKNGLSLTEISGIMRIPKGTIGNWVRDIVLSKEQSKRLDDKKEQQWRNIKDVGLKHHLKRIKEHKEWFDAGKKMILNDEIEIMGLISYACEGTHSLNCDGIVITNTEPEIINLFLKFIEKSFNIHRSNFHCSVHIHDYHNQKKVKLYWMNKLKIERVTIYVNKKQRGGKRKKLAGTKHKNGYMGCAHVRMGNIEVRCNLEGLIDKYIGRNYLIGEGRV